MDMIHRFLIQEVPEQLANIKGIQVFCLEKMA